MLSIICAKRNVLSQNIQFWQNQSVNKIFFLENFTGVNGLDSMTEPREACRPRPTATGLKLKQTAQIHLHLDLLPRPRFLRVWEDLAQ